MGIIKAVVGAVGGTLADQWLEVIESDQMSDTSSLLSTCACTVTGSVIIR